MRTMDYDVLADISLVLVYVLPELLVGIDRRVRAIHRSVIFDDELPGVV